MPSVGRTSQAELDLIEIGVRIALDDPAAADRWLDLIDQKCQLLATMPEMGRDRKDLFPHLRSFPVGDYILFYRPTEQGIVIIRVLHGARDIRSFF
ncbi:MAG TPA: type II toxin-antitoxin system RelE/ParE family toxin [Verrucomicrobiae bacterium]|jgi:toxin ParE1/3/4|nr:type II toxin-antitoxin system RelE/ParE family toxin [Verrucomicrobiae bacterium]